MSRHRRRRAYRKRKHYWQQLRYARGKRAMYEAHCRRTYAPEIFKLAVTMLRCEDAFVRALGGRAGPPYKIRAASYRQLRPAVRVAW